MNAISSPPAPAAAAAQASPPAPAAGTDPAIAAHHSTDACPLCGAPLASSQEWCLHCGAAARTRLAASPNWRWPIAAIAVVAALCLGAIAASLVKLAGDSGPAPAAITRTVTASAAVATPTTPAATSPATTTTAPPGSATAAGAGAHTRTALGGVAAAGTASTRTGRATTRSRANLGLGRLRVKLPAIKGLGGLGLPHVAQPGVAGPSTGR